MSKPSICINKEATALTSTPTVVQVYEDLSTLRNKQRHPLDCRSPNWRQPRWLKPPQQISSTLDFIHPKCTGSRWPMNVTPGQYAVESSASLLTIPFHPFSDHAQQQSCVSKPVSWLWARRAIPGAALCYPKFSAKCRNPSSTSSPSQPSGETRATSIWSKVDQC